MLDDTGLHFVKRSSTTVSIRRIQPETFEENYEFAVIFGDGHESQTTTVRAMENQSTQRAKVVLDVVI